MSDGQPKVETSPRAVVQAASTAAIAALNLSVEQATVGGLLGKRLGAVVGLRGGDASACVGGCGRNRTVSTHAEATRNKGTGYALPLGQRTMLPGQPPLTSLMKLARVALLLRDTPFSIMQAAEFKAQVPSKQHEPCEPDPATSTLSPHHRIGRERHWGR